MLPQSTIHVPASHCCAAPCPAPRRTPPCSGERAVADVHAAARGGAQHVRHDQQRRLAADRRQGPHRGARAASCMLLLLSHLPCCSCLTSPAAPVSFPLPLNSQHGQPYNACYTHPHPRCSLLLPVGRLPAAARHRQQRQHPAGRPAGLRALHCAPGGPGVCPVLCLYCTAPFTVGTAATGRAWLAPLLQVLLPFAFNQSAVDAIFATLGTTGITASPPPPPTATTS